MAQKALDRDALLATANAERQTEEVEIPELGGVVKVRELSAGEMDAYQASLMKQVGGEVQQDFTNSTAKLVVRCLVNDDGEPLFDARKEIDQVGAMPAHILQPIAEAARRVNGMTGAEQAAMEGNSDAAGGDGSSST